MNPREEEYKVEKGRVEVRKKKKQRKITTITMTNR